MINLALFAAVGITAGGWEMNLDEPSQTLTFSNPVSKVEVSGTVSFQTKRTGWKITAPRDAVPSRYALVDPSRNVQGYLSFQANGGRLQMLVYHRTAQAYEGELTYRGTIHFRPDAFACRTRPRTTERVLQLAAGDPDSLLNDSLFPARKIWRFRSKPPIFL